METYESNTRGQYIYIFSKHQLYQVTFSNSESDYRHITTNKKRFFMKIIFPGSATLNHLQRFSIHTVKKSHMCEEHLRISVWHLLMNLKNNYLLKRTVEVGQ